MKQDRKIDKEIIYTKEMKVDSKKETNIKDFVISIFAIITVVAVILVIYYLTTISQTT